jgi:hypothetical protein
MDYRSIHVLCIAFLAVDRNSHEKDSDDEEVSIPLKVESLDERMSGFIVIECPGIPEIGSVEIIE